MKKLICLTLICLTFLSCKKDDDNNTTNPTGLSIGDTYQGGIIFYLDGNGGGLIAAPTDQSSAEWGCYGTLISGADGTAIGTGAQNTIDIELGCTTPGTAADICANLTLGGYSDWFLPARKEIDEMYQNKSTIGVFGSGDYWTSGGGSATNASSFGFTNGTHYTKSKNNYYNVRAVRSF